MSDYRRIVLRPHLVAGLRNALLEARADLSARDFEYRCAVADLKAEVETLRGEVRELRDVLLLLTSLRREQAEEDLATLRRQLEVVLVKLAQRQPGVTLQ
jgi:hypothetical protein